jgi:hypothetical protein
VGAHPGPPRRQGSPTSHDTFLTAPVKAALTPHVVTTFHESRSPVSLEGLTFGLAGGDGGDALPPPSGAKARLCNVVCLWALVVAMLFLD